MEQADKIFPETLNLSLVRKQMLRYGENPHQSAAIYLTGEKRFCVINSKVMQGKELSQNNITDADSAYECVAEFSTPACVIVKHKTPCGAAISADQMTAFIRARTCDPLSAFGGVIAINRLLDEKLARIMMEGFVEVIITPYASEAAIRALQQKPDIRLLVAGGISPPQADGLVYTCVAGGIVAQTRDSIVFGDEMRVVTLKQPTEHEMSDMRFAFTVAKHVRSNAIVYAKGGATVGIGGGEVSRVDAAITGARKAMDAGRAAKELKVRTHGSVAASDAFFPFADGLDEVVNAGATCVIQPGGSKKDEAVIEAANKHGIAMVMTGVRHFRH
ncbi:MAG: purH [Candidatus Kaiserbacteria bacterium]|nr:purH [Candidatus Kaiserbacteria bacterium]